TTIHGSSFILPEVVSLHLAICSLACPGIELAIPGPLWVHPGSPLPASRVVETRSVGRHPLDRGETQRRGRTSIFTKPGRSRLPSEGSNLRGFAIEGDTTGDRSLDREVPCLAPPEPILAMPRDRTMVLGGRSAPWSTVETMVLRDLALDHRDRRPRS